MLYIFCAAGGMRIAEVLGLDIDKLISSDCRVIKVRGQVKGNKIVPYVKTDAAYREIDLCAEVAELLKNYIGSRHGLLGFEIPPPSFVPNVPKTAEFQAAVVAV